MKTIHAILISLCLLFGLGSVIAGPDARPNLSGLIVETNGLPIGQATVFIYSAGPKVGTSSLCPYCYADCAKKAQTDATGRFTIKSLDPSLIFRLLVVANGHESKIVSKVNPAKGAQKIALRPLTREELQSDSCIKGMIVGEDGKSVPQAVVSTEGIGTGEGQQWGGTDPYVEPMAVADDDGHFVLFAKSKSVNMVYATVDGRGVARQWVSFKPGSDYLVRLQSGVTVTGNVVRDGSPLKGVSVGVATTDRTCGSYFNGYGATTDEKGNFQIFNVPPGREFVFFTTMDSLHGKGAAADTVFSTGDSDSIKDLGVLAVKPAFTVAGRIVLEGGKSVPTRTKMLLSREKAWDTTQVTIGPDGSFRFKGVPAGPVSLSVSVKGYKLAKTNPSLDWMNGDILGRVTGNVTNLNILLVPGKWQFNQQDDRPEGVEAYPINNPLNGIALSTSGIARP